VYDELDLTLHGLGGDVLGWLPAQGSAPLEGGVGSVRQAVSLPRLCTSENVQYNRYLKTRFLIIAFYFLTTTKSF
jgi:hypothetical protein